MSVQVTLRDRVGGLVKRLKGEAKPGVVVVGSVRLLVQAMGVEGVESGPPSYGYQPPLVTEGKTTGLLFSSNQRETAAFQVIMVLVGQGEAKVINAYGFRASLSGSALRLT